MSIDLRQKRSKRGKGRTYGAYGAYGATKRARKWVATLRLHGRWSVSCSMMLLDRLRTRDSASTGPCKRGTPAKQSSLPRRARIVAPLSCGRTSPASGIASIATRRPFGGPGTWQSGRHGCGRRLRQGRPSRLVPAGRPALGSIRWPPATLDLSRGIYKALAGREDERPRFARHCKRVPCKGSDLSPVSDRRA